MNNGTFKKSSRAYQKQKYGLAKYLEMHREYARRCYQRRIGMTIPDHRKNEQKTGAESGGDIDASLAAIRARKINEK